MSALATVTHYNREFYVTIADADIRSLKSLNTSFDKYKNLDHIVVIFEQNRMVRTTQNFELFHKNKWRNIFGKALKPFWRHFCNWNNCLMLDC